MTLYLCLKLNADIHQKVLIGDEVLRIWGTSAELIPGEEVKVLDLFHGLMLPSGNDAAFVLAKHYGKIIM